MSQEGAPKTSGARSVFAPSGTVSLIRFETVTRLTFVAIGMCGAVVPDSPCQTTPKVYG